MTAPHRFQLADAAGFCRECGRRRDDPMGQHVEDVRIPGIGGRLIEGGAGPCVWCGRETPATDIAWAPGLDREVPLHPLPCGAQITIAFRAYINGRPMPRPWLEERARKVLGERPVPLLTEGDR